MFSGIVEEAAPVVNLVKEKENLHIYLSCSFIDDVFIGQSISHNGVCLTVADKKDNYYVVTAVKETLEKTNLGLLKIGDKVNLERSLTLNKFLDGHIVLGHVDQTAICTEIVEVGGSWYFTFEYDPSYGNFTIEKGSIAVNGVSLTVVNSQKGKFSVAIIPHTYKVTNFHQLKVGSIVNLEFDVIGKYIYKIINSQINEWKKFF